VLAGPVRTAEPEPVLVLTRNSQACKVGAMRMTRRRSWGAAAVLSCLAWVLIGLPVLACALGWVLR
jgi:biotin transporter BioY